MRTSLPLASRSTTSSAVCEIFRPVKTWPFFVVAW